MFVFLVIFDSINTPNFKSIFSNSFFVYFDVFSKSENTIFLLFKICSSVGSGSCFDSCVCVCSSLASLVSFVAFLGSSISGFINIKNSLNSGIAFTNCVAVFSANPSIAFTLSIFSFRESVDVKIVGSAFKI